VNVLYVSTLYPPCIGGAQIQLHCLAKAMQQAGHNAKVITISSRKRQDWLRMSTVFAEKEKDYEFEGVPVTQLGFSLATRIAMAPWAAAYYGCMAPAVRALARLTYPYLEKAAEKPDLVHVTRIGREFICQAALDFARKHHLPFVLTPNHHPRWRGYLYRQYDRIYREADALCVYTSEEKRVLVEEKGVPEERIHITGVGPVLADSFSAESFCRNHGVKQDEFILFIGQQYRYKGVEAMLKAAPIVWSRFPDMRFVFIGPHTNDTDAMFQDISDNRIMNLGVVDAETKTSALAACCMLCLPSTQESFGGVYAEAWCHRRPVIGGNIPPIAAVITNGKDGILSSQDPDELAENMCTLLANPAMREKMGNEGWKKVQINYTWSTLAEKTLSAYRPLLA